MTCCNGQRGVAASTSASSRASASRTPSPNATIPPGGGWAKASALLPEVWLRCLQYTEIRGVLGARCLDRHFRKLGEGHELWDSLLSVRELFPAASSVRYRGSLTGAAKYRHCLGAFKANADFYKALGCRDLRRMREAWLRGPHVRCAFRGSPVAEGFEAVMLCLEEAFAAHADEDEPLGQRATARPVQQSWVVYDDTAVVTLREDLGRQQTLEVTNVLEHVQQFQWKLVHHHSSYGRPALP